MERRVRGRLLYSDRAQGRAVVAVLPKLKLWVLACLFTLGVAAVIVGVLELALRMLALRGADESRDHVMMTRTLSIVYRPNHRGVLWNIEFATNRLGIRDDEVETGFGGGEIRVLSLGDSIAFGLGIEASAHYSQLIEGQLTSESGRQVRVINGAGKGYSPSSYAVFLREEGLILQPDLVVIEIELNNDVTDEALLGIRFLAGDPMPVAVTGGRYVVSWDGNLLSTVSRGPYLYERTYLCARLVRGWLNLLYAWRPNEPFAETEGVTYYTLGFDRAALTEERIESGWTQMYDVLEATHDFLQQHGVGFLLVVMPSRYMYDDRTPQHRDFARALTERAVQMAAERSLPTLDMSASIGAGGGAALYFDFAHLTEQGNRVVADALTPEIAAILGITEKSP